MLRVPNTHLGAHFGLRHATAICITEFKLDNTDPESPVYLLNDVVTAHVGLLRGPDDFTFFPYDANKAQVMATVAAVLYGERISNVP